MKKHFFITTVVFVILSVWVFVYSTKQIKSQELEKSGTPVIADHLKYVSIGDSYTSGEGAGEGDMWPKILIEDLEKENIYFQLEANLAVSGFTSREVSTIQLPLVENIKPDLLTIFVGANDLFQMTNIEIFEKEYAELLDKAIASVPSSTVIVVVNIPDHTKAPAFRHFPIGTGSASLIERYNSVIEKLVKEKNITVVDIYSISQLMTDEKYYSQDGLHPSALGAKKWEIEIFNVVSNLIKDEADVQLN